MSQAVRPTKKQHELLDYIEGFIAEHGYSPSYREIMNGLGYNSVATVALHIGNLIKRGHLRKRDHSARSLEVVRDIEVDDGQADGIDDASHQAWLVGRVEAYFRQAAQDRKTPEIDTEVQVVLSALELLGFSQQAGDLRLRLKHG